MDGNETPLSADWSTMQSSFVPQFHTTVRILKAADDYDSIDVWLTNQQKGVFHSSPHVEIEYSSMQFLPLNVKTKNLTEFLVLFFFVFFYLNFSAFNIKSEKE